MNATSLHSPDGPAERVASAVHVARRLCEERGLRLTHLRLATLEEVARSGPISAYRLMSSLAGRLGRRLDPPTVYRALEFLTNAGLLARLESRSAYVVRLHPEQTQLSVLLLCDRCESTIELEDPRLVRLIEGDAAALGFRLGSPIIECSGTCERCAEEGGEVAR